MKNRLHGAVGAKIAIFFGLFVNIGFICAQFEPVVYHRGKDRVFQVMYTGPGGIKDVHDKIVLTDTKNLEQDLNLSELSARIGCKTNIGQAFLAYSLEKVISPKDLSSTIESRQQFIKLLVENLALQEKFELILQEAVVHEAVVMKFMENRFAFGGLNEKSTLSDYVEYVGHGMNSSIPWQSYDKVKNAVNLAISPYAMYKKYKAAGESFATVGRSWNNLSAATRALATGFSLATLGSSVYSLGSFGVLSGQYALNDAPDLLLSPLMTALAGYGLYKHYTKALEIRDAMYSLNRLIDVARQIEDVCHQYGVKHQFKMSSIQSQDGMNLLDSLRQTRYTDKDTSVVLSPVVHSFAYDVYEHDIHLAPIYASIAEMDVYVALAQKMAQLQYKNNKFCFVEFLDKAKPEIQATSFWNLLVSQGTVVVNSLSEDKNIILTGANEGGKTTSIRAILQNIVLAQTFGIAAATEFKLTQFDRVYSYLNIKDDILHGKSRFASELSMAREILDSITALPKDEKLFFVLDELFTGTNGKDGEECAYDFIDNIASYPHIQFIYATHFDKLKEIGLKNQTCVNYKVGAPLRDGQGKFMRDTRGQLIYPYTLSPGANDINIAMERARDAGIFKHDVVVAGA